METRIAARVGRGPFARGFTLVELLISMTITLVLILLLVQSISSTQKVWTRTKAQAESFKEARAAFESMSRELSQTTLNSYWDYGYAASDTAKANPTYYARQSELHFVCGPSETLIAKNLNLSGHAVFFQAPTGFSTVATTDPAYGLESLLNASGFFVKYDTDTAQKAAFMKAPLNPPRKRFRLMEFKLPSEKLQIFKPETSAPAGTLPAPALSKATTTADLYSWFRPSVTVSATTTTGSAILDYQPLADNILAVFIQPVLTPDTSATAAQATPTDYIYDTRAHQLAPTPRASKSRHQLPPRLTLTLIALDESSWARLTTAEADATALQLQTLINTKLFQIPPTDQKPTLFSDDLLKLEEALMSRGNDALKKPIQYRVFTTTIAIRAAKWISAIEK